MKKKPVPPDKTQPAPRNRRQWVVVSYDVIEDKRRTRIMKTLEGYGSHVQYSVFECELRPADLERLLNRLRTLIQAESDDIRCYPLCENCLAKVVTLGRARLHRQDRYRMVP
jgi:CRISPR-associated protein Cas2